MLLSIKNIPANTRRKCLAWAQLLTVTYVSYSMFIIASVYLLVLIKLLFTPYYYVVLAYLIFLYFDKDTCESGGRRIEWVRRSSIWNFYCSYFSMKLIRSQDCKMDSKKNYIFATFPHGFFGTAGLGNFGTEATGFSKKFPGFTPHLLTLKMNFFFPLFRDRLLAAGICAVTKKSIRYLLNYPNGGKIAIIYVGGAEESLYFHPGEYTIVLKKRKGFIRIALECGAGVVPVFNFGEPDIYDQVTNPTILKLQKTFKHYLGFSPIVPLGRGFFQNQIGLTPKKRHLTTIVGKPIDLPKIETPTEKDVDKYHQIFIKELTELFEKNKTKYVKNPEQTFLVIK